MPVRSAAGSPHNEAAAPSHGHQQSPDHDQYRGAEVDQESIDRIFNFIRLVVQAVDCDAGRTELSSAPAAHRYYAGRLSHVDLVPEGNPRAMAGLLFMRSRCDGISLQPRWIVATSGQADQWPLSRPLTGSISISGRPTAAANLPIDRRPPGISARFLLVQEAHHPVKNRGQSAAVFFSDISAKISSSCSPNRVTLPTPFTSSAHAVRCPYCFSSLDS